MVRLLVNNNNQRGSAAGRFLCTQILVAVKGPNYHGLTVSTPLLSSPLLIDIIHIPPSSF